MKSPALHQAAQVHYTVSVLNADGSVSGKLARKRNLILDQGLDMVGTAPWTNCFAAAALGTGTTPTKRDSGAVTVSRAGSTLTASAGFFEAADVGRLFKFDTGEEVRITAYTSATQVTTASSGAIAAAEGTVWYVNQTALTTETKRSANYTSGGGDNGSVWVAPTWTHKRTFLFSAETGTVNYREIGWSNTTETGANLFGRDLLAGGGVTLVAGQQLKVSVELSVSYGPAGPVAWTNPVTGWTSNGVQGVERLTPGQACSLVNSGGTSSGAAALDPSGPARLALLSNSSAIISMTTTEDNLSGLLTFANATLSAYTPGSFFRKKSAAYGVGSNLTGIRSLSLSMDADAARPAYRVLLDTAEAKLDTQTLALEYTLSWGRVLVN